jgi:hypothetical protein
VVKGWVLSCAVGLVLVATAQGCDAFGDSSGADSADAKAPEGPGPGGGEGGTGGPDPSPPDGSRPADAAGCGTTAWLQPKTAEGTDWAPVDYARVADGNAAIGSFSTVTALTAALTVHDFGAGVPPAAQIQGIEVAVTRKGTVEGAVWDDSVSLVAEGVVLGHGQPSPGAWVWQYGCGSPEVRYGGSNNVWGITPTALTADAVNKASFGVAIVARGNLSGTTPPQAMVDGVSIMIYYCAP